MKKSSIDTSQQLVTNFDYAQLVLDKALNDFEIDQIFKGINQSLDNRNKDEFLRLTDKLKVIQKQHNKHV